MVNSLFRRPNHVRTPKKLQARIPKSRPVPALKAKMPGVKVILAGYPTDQIEAHKASGVDDFIHLKVDCLAFLTNLQKEL